MDADNDGHVTKEELTSYIKRIDWTSIAETPPAPSEIDALTVHLLNTLDTDGDGVITKEEMKIGMHTIPADDFGDGNGDSLELPKSEVEEGIPLVVAPQPQL